ncbi:MAG: hypothetical protein HYY20_02745 [Candidatus Tectomicrobia bacterium]|uniref:Uncharacterized protein n=1 Tax=Tectimicrobiota bacterium TaxID=2528274 RepID=A0A932CMN9_UNCTE|nr:hypothetical protein [Candidatus Tectomicrobia bacterium]
MLVFLPIFPVSAAGESLLDNPLRELFVKPLTEAFPKLELRGYLMNESDILLHNTGDTPLGGGRHLPIHQQFQRIEWVGELRYKYYFTPNLTLVGQLDFLYDASFDWQKRALGKDAAPERELESFHSFRRWFREAYLLWSTGDWELRLGKQQIVWGKATDIGHFVDQAHGYDLRELHDTAVDDTELTRRTVWMADISYYLANTPVGDLEVELLWIPDYEESVYAPSPYLQSTAFIFRNRSRGLRFLKTDKPSASFKNHEWGARLSTFTKGGWDLGLYFLYMWEKAPTNFIKGIDVAALRAGRPWVVVEPKPARMTMLGGTVEKMHHFLGKDWTLRGELAYFLNRYRATRNEQPQARDIVAGFLAPGKDGYARRDEMRWALNAETTFKPPFVPGPSDWILTTWMSVYNYFGYDNDQTEMGKTLDKWQTFGIVSISKGFWNERANFSTAIAYNDGGSWRFAGPKLTYEFTNTFNVGVGYSGYAGNRDDVWGWGDRNFDEIQIELTYTF